jgi:hypothetical protein
MSLSHPLLSDSTAVTYSHPPCLHQQSATIASAPTKIARARAQSPSLYTRVRGAGPSPVPWACSFWAGNHTPRPNDHASKHHPQDPHISPWQQAVLFVPPASTDTQLCRTHLWLELLVQSVQLVSADVVADAELRYLGGARRSAQQGVFACRPAAPQAASRCCASAPGSADAATLQCYKFLIVIIEPGCIPWDEE